MVTCAGDIRFRSAKVTVPGSLTPSTLNVQASALRRMSSLGRGRLLRTKNRDTGVIRPAPMAARLVSRASGPVLWTRKCSAERLSGSADGGGRASERVGVASSGRHAAPTAAAVPAATKPPSSARRPRVVPSWEVSFAMRNRNPGGVCDRPRRALAIAAQSINAPFGQRGNRWVRDMSSL